MLPSSAATNTLRPRSCVPPPPPVRKGRLTDGMIILQIRKQQHKEVKQFTQAIITCIDFYLADSAVHVLSSDALLEAKPGLEGWF